MGAQAIEMVGSTYGAMQEAKAAREEGKEALRTAGRDVRRQRQELESAKKSQTMDFLSSGVQLEGTPLEVLAETERRGQEDIQETLRQGKRQADTFRRQGRNRLMQQAFQTATTITKGSGKAASGGFGGG
jgi:hypothetical protein